MLQVRPKTKIQADGGEHMHPCVQRSEHKRPDKREKTHAQRGWMHMQQACGAGWGGVGERRRVGERGDEEPRTFMDLMAS